VVELIDAKLHVVLISNLEALHQLGIMTMFRKPEAARNAIGIGVRQLVPPKQFIVSTGLTTTGAILPATSTSVRDAARRLAEAARMVLPAASGYRHWGTLGYEL